MRQGILPEHGLKHKGNHYASLPWFGTKLAQTNAKRDQNKKNIYISSPFSSRRETPTLSTKRKWGKPSFLLSLLQGNVRSQRFVHAQWRLEKKFHVSGCRRQASDVCCLRCLVIRVAITCWGSEAFLLSFCILKQFHNMFVWSLGFPLISCACPLSQSN